MNNIVQNSHAGPRFSRLDLKKAIPAHCFKSSIIKSLSYFLLDFSIIVILYTLMYLIQPVWSLPLFWFALGTMFWAIFVVGHDCGHGSFSKIPRLNKIIGYLCHTALLVPFYSWKVSHAKHHLNTASIENDEVFRIFTESEYQSLGWFYRLVRFKLFLFFFPFYLLGIIDKDPHKWPKNSHFFPKSHLFTKNDYFPVLCSTFLCITTLLFYAYLGYSFGIFFILKYYGIPYLVFIVWLTLVTFLHHTDMNVPFYRKSVWTNFSGSLSTIDRDYGRILNFLQNNINLHVVHHLFPNIPHYHLKEATQYIIPILGKYYLQPVSLSIIKSFFKSAKDCQFVLDQGEIVYFYKGTGHNQRDHKPLEESNE